VVVEYIRYEIEPERAAEFEQAYARASAALDESEHCLSYELARGVEEPGNWILRIEWDSLEGHEQGFRKSPGFAPFFQAVKPFFGQIAEMKHYEATSVAA
jgi:quinol monooxygenase YgiN